MILTNGKERVDFEGYVKFEAYLYQSDGDSPVQFTNLSYHKCTKNDEDLFYEQIAEEENFTSLEAELDKLYCLDDPSLLNL